MKALVYQGERRLACREVPQPAPADGEVIVAVESVGICGSDMHAFLGHDERRPPPLILGHEAAGVVKTGSLAGRRVTVNPLVACGQCPVCRSGRDNICPGRQILSMQPREGAFAQMIAVPPANLFEIPDNISFDVAALAEPLACGWHAVRLARRAMSAEIDRAGVLVIGGGAIGVGAALSLEAAGAPDITLSEPNPGRRAYLRDACGLAAIAPEELGEDEQFDLIVDAVGFAATRSQAIAHARPGGVITHIGLGGSGGEADFRRMTLQEITFIGTYTYTKQDFRETARAICDGRMGPLDWVERRPLGGGQSAFEDILAGRVEAPKIILKPNE
ncbi:alcohol dehydrogenase catalytic domain-containing protein [Nitratireductor sp. XY-223]|uniref:zinc-dependent alcohol dehydrogenase n=1 Tax=Nitratireductor sp. XY-223 TaxID=2561926 RepID=UPI0010AB091C|nr:alcohol dehydrogenase catalytic domain-containing protein [Nitratireductor sp. XY-223]